MYVVDDNDKDDHENESDHDFDIFFNQNCQQIFKRRIMRGSSSFTEPQNGSPHFGRPFISPPTNRRRFCMSHHSNSLFLLPKKNPLDRHGNVM